MFSILNMRTWPLEVLKIILKIKLKLKSTICEDLKTCHSMMVPAYLVHFTQFKKFLKSIYPDYK